MSKTKVLVLVTLLVLTVGLIAFGGAMMAMKWDFTRLSFSKFETNEHTVKGPFSDITVIGDTARITFAPSGDGEVKVVCYEKERARHTVSVEDGRLVIRLDDERKWYDYINISGSPRITVYLPGGEYGALTVERRTGKLEIPADFSFASVDIEGSTGDTVLAASSRGALCVKASTGDIRLQGVTAGSVELRASTGDITLSSVTSGGSLLLSVSTGKICANGVSCAGDATVSVSTGRASLLDLTCKNLVSTGNTGDLTLTNVIAEGAFTIERSTGDVKFTSCDAATLSVKTNTGDVLGTLRSDKIFYTRTNTGRVEVPKLTSGGICEVTTSTGKIILSVE